MFGWSSDGKSLVGIRESADRHRQIVSVDVAKPVEKVLGELPLQTAAELRGFSLSPDGKSFVTSASQPRSSLWVLKGFRRPTLLGWLR